MFATSSGIQTVKGMRASSPGRTLARLAVMACTQPSASQRIGPSRTSSVGFSMRRMHWRALPGASTGAPRKRMLRLRAAGRAAGTATKGAAVTRTGSFSPRASAMAMHISPARAMRAAIASPTSDVEGAPWSSPRNAAASRSGWSPSRSESSTSVRRGSREPSTPP